MAHLDASNSVQARADLRLWAIMKNRSKRGPVSRAHVGCDVCLLRGDIGYVGTERRSCFPFAVWGGDGNAKKLGIETGGCARSRREN